MNQSPDILPYSGLAQLAAKLLQTPVSLFTLADSSSLRMIGSAGWSGPTCLPRSGTYCDQVLSSGQPVVYTDADGSLGGIRAYAGFPVRDSHGSSLGTFSVLDFVPREFTQSDLDSLSQLAAQASALLDLRQSHNTLATLAHEVRTPLNGILGSVEILERDLGSSDLLQAISTSARILGEIVADPLSNPIGASKPHSEAFSLTQICDLLHRNFIPLARKHQLDLSFDLHSAFLESVLGDPRRLSQILQNLIGNAIKFTPPGGSVHVSVKPNSLPGHTRFLVRDTGPGIPPEVLPNIFEPYTHGPADQFRNWESTGMGLSITRDHVAALGGQIRISSLPGQGTTAQVDLFLPPVSALPRGLRVLVVEDSPINQFVVRRLLALLGCEVEAARDGLAALQFLDSAPFDVILMDCLMPGMDGYETTREIRGRNLHTPIIAVTGQVSPQDRAACLECGMNGVLPKPIDLISLKKELISALQYSQAKERSLLARDARTIPVAHESNERRGL